MLSAKSKGARLYGVDALRIFSMFMIAMLHVLRAGGVLDAVEPFTPNYYASWALEILAYPAVDVFGVISGYVGFGGKHRVSRLVQLCAMTIVFDVMITIAALCLGVNLGLKGIIGSLFPPIVGNYWYLSSFICLYPFLRLIDKLVYSQSERGSKATILTLLFLLSFVPTIISNDFAGTKRGYSVTWLAVLYYIGACLRRFNWLESLKKNGGVAYLFLAVLTLASKLLIDFVTIRFLGRSVLSMLLITYDSPLILAAAVCILLRSTTWSIPDWAKRKIGFISAASFAVYVIHCNPAIFNNVITDKMQWIAYLSPFKLVASCFIICSGIYLVGAIAYFLFDSVWKAGECNRRLAQLDHTAESLYEL